LGGGEERQIQPWSNPELTQQAEVGSKVEDSSKTTREGLELLHVIDTSAVVPPVKAVTSNPYLESPCAEAVLPALLKRVKEEHDVAKAVKSDDAEVPVHLWDCAVFGREPSEEEGKALALLRQRLMVVYQYWLWREIRHHMEEAYGKGWVTKATSNRDRDAPAHQAAAKSAKAMREILWQATNNNWFE
jgi:hypothetical protein